MSAGLAEMIVWSDWSLSYIQNQHKTVANVARDLGLDDGLPWV